MIDTAKIYVQAGNGGCGCNSFKGKKFTRTRRADGGNGGKGSDIIIKVDSNIQSLEQLQLKQYFRAENGKGGQANKKRGADGRPCIIKVPAGTIVRDLDNNLLLRDLVELDEQLLVVKAGEGGKGNTKTKAATAGLPGEARHLYLELKLVADIGLVGYPNSGKSTLLSKLTAARPKIAAYPFTSKSPVLGMLEFSDFAEPNHLVIIEIPALTKGSSEGKGLGVKFLRHAERAKVLIHLIDIAALEGRNPVEDYHNLNQELKLHSLQLAQRPQILVANKMDLPQAAANLSSFRSKVKRRLYPISAVKGEGLQELLNHLRSYF